jgi:hypothetical protein
MESTPVSASAPRRSPVQLAAEGFAALVDKLGLADAVRFIQLYDPGRGDYTRDRTHWLGALTHDEVAGLMSHAEAAGSPHDNNSAS